MAGSNNFADMLKNSVTEKVFSAISGQNGHHEERTILGIKLNQDEFEKVTSAIASAASAIGPILAKSREKTADVVQSVPSKETFEEKFSAAIETIDKRGAEARERVKSGATNAREATTQAAANAREATTQAAANAREATTHAAANAREAAANASASARDATSHAATSAREATSHAAAETADAGKNLLGLLFWLGALGAAIYYFFLNEERREQVIEAAKSSKNVVCGIVSEIRGEDGVFNG